MKYTEWELTVGLYPGILLGFRSYNLEGLDSDNNEFVQSSHVFYLPFVDLCLTIYR